MSVSIRMKMAGRKHLPFFNICVFPTLARRDGQPIEELGLYNPAPSGKEEAVRLNVERARYWLEQGAKPSDTVAKIFRENGLKGDLWAHKPGKPRKAKKTAKPAAKKPAAKADGAKPAKKRKARTANSKLKADRTRAKPSAE